MDYLQKKGKERKDGLPKEKRKGKRKMDYLKKKGKRKETLTT